jgi:RimJ/RimL family protein N-acetyltransferase
MTVTLTRTDPEGQDRESLIAFHTSAEFPFHVCARPGRADMERVLDAGTFRDEDHESWWIDDPDAGRIGLVVLEDLQEPSPLLDLRLAPAFRGQGLGVVALRAVTDHVFRTMPAVPRLEGQTREDNIAMRRVFLRAGWVKEAHYRESWPVEGGSALASVAYAVLRHDWETGTTTTFVWDDVTLTD